VISWVLFKNRNSFKIKKNYDFFETTGKLKNFEFYESHHFVDLDELIFVYAVREVQDSN